MTHLIENKTFERIDQTISALERAEYENCTFKNCSFYSADLSNFVFRSCIFDGCDLSLAALKNTTLNDIQFTGCKLLGVKFHKANHFLLSFRFENCILNHSVFYRMKLKKTNFVNCKMEETDFTETDLTSSLLDNCDLNRTVFYNSILEKTDFRSAYNYSFDPERNRIKKARFSRLGVTGLLEKYHIEIE